MRSHKNIAVGLVCLSIASCAASSQTHAASATTRPTEKAISIAKVRPVSFDGPETVEGLDVGTEKSATAPHSSLVRVANPDVLASKVNLWAVEEQRKLSRPSAKEYLTMSPGVCGASGTIVCFAVDSTRHVQGKKAVSTQIWYLDMSDKSVRQSQDLLTQSGKNKVVHALDSLSPDTSVSMSIKRVLKPNSDSPTATPTSDSTPVATQSASASSTSAPAPSASSDSQNGMGSAGVFFQSDGSLVLRAPNDEKNGFDSYRVASRDVEKLLTEEGKKLRSGIMQKANPVPIPKPESKPIPKPDVDCRVASCVALTFDDGPGDQTDRLLAALREKGVRATFFTIGKNVKARPDLVKKEAAEGHSVGNHSWDHPQLTKLTPEELRKQLKNTSNSIVEAGAPAPVLMRPPYGSSNADVLKAIGENGMAETRWDVDTEDWKNKNAAVTTQRALAGARPGSVILMHDIHASSVDAVPGLIDQLKAKGYTLVTVPQLMGDDMTPYIGHRIFSQRNVK
ncbi:polysaccharide deacetylase family protein [Peptidiphaga gingivicola]|uniref:polysaccharide deacetylase family protein n=1 Tax=Peptidiphaga gingivicola TaxID=2741497 RepID=UPI000A53CC86|nr:polysaccharide deacetylase family protein [Peptidiphaga gingivicola]